MKIDLSYIGNPRRSSEIAVTVEADGDKEIYKFDNNMDGVLIQVVPEKEC